MKMHHCLVFALALYQVGALFAATQTDIIGPAGSDDFGSNVTLLPNGNIVVTDPTYDQPSPPLANAGAVYLYSHDGVLISKLTGGAANNQVGSGGVLVLKNGNFVVKSPQWDNTSPAATDAGAATWGSATTGFGAASVVVSAANSLVGSTLSDGVGGASVVALPNGNYVVVTPNWNIPSGAADVGAVTYCNGTTGTSGAVATTNSLTGSTAGDTIGLFGIKLAGTGNYLVNGHQWSVPAGAAHVGAITWCNGNTGIPVGAGSPGVAVSAANSLVGSTLNDHLGSGGIVNLPNGNCVVITPDWDVPSVTINAGAVTWINGNTGALGPLAVGNSLIGASTNDHVGSQGVTVLTNGNYVVGSSSWSIPSGATSVGAATWCSGATGRIGTVTAANSLTGTTAFDMVSGYGIFALTNGNYIVASGDWDIPSGASNVGAVTWCNGTTGLVGTVGAANSLVGGTADDYISSYGIALLTNGNYVVMSPNWDLPSGATDVGAVTWGNGTTGSKGTIASANSLVGSTAGDNVGGDGVVPLTNGNYVVVSSLWSVPSGAAGVGAVTWGSGASGVKGSVSSANSLIGKTAGDSVGLSGVTALTNGNYVVGSEQWSNPTPTLVSNAGAATWGSGTSGVKGFISSANSLIGTVLNDHVANNGIQALPNGNYVVRSPLWNNGALVKVGAVTWSSGSAGVKGVISANNSLIGSSANDSLGSHLSVQDDSHYVVRSSNWDQTIPATANDVGAVTLGNGAAGTFGFITASHSVFGGTPSGGNFINSVYDAAREILAVGRPADNKVTILKNEFRTLAKSNEAAPGALDIAFSTAGSAAVNSIGAVTCDYTLTGAGSSGKNRAIYSTTTSTDSLDLAMQSGTIVAALGTGLPSNAKVASVLNPLNQQANRSLFQATFSGTGITSANNRMLLLDNGLSVSILRRTGQPFGFGALASATATTFTEVLQSYDADMVTLSYVLAANTSLGINSSSDTGILTFDHSGIVSTNQIAREGQAAFGGSGTFGQFTGRAAAGFGNLIHFAASLKPTTGSAVAALFTMTSDGLSTSLAAKVGDLAPGPAVTGDTVVKFASFPAFSQLAGLPLFKATLSGCSSTTNEGLFRGAVVRLIRKGDEVDATTLPGVKFGSISKFWPAGANQVIVQTSLTGTGVTSSNNQALVLNQANGTNLILLRTGSTPPGIDAAKVLSISSVDVNPVNGRYVILASLTSSPSTSNQALWTGSTAVGADTPVAQQALRLPLMRLRKGDHYTSSETPLGVIKSLTLKPAVDASGAGGRGLAQSIGSGGDVAVYILGDRSLTELVMLPP